MKTLEQKKHDRFLFLKSVYEHTDGSTSGILSMWEVGKGLNFSEEETRVIVEYLRAERLIVSMTLGGGIGISHAGVKEVEEALGNPDRPTEHFLPVNIINIGSMNNSTIQQATSYSSVSNSKTVQNSDSLRILIDLLKENIASIQVEKSQKAELQSDIGTLEMQHQSPKPKPSIINEALRSVRTILEGAAGNNLPEIIEKINGFLI